MTRPCERWLGWIAPDQEHLQTCASCREQWRAHQRLRDLATLARPELDPGFSHRTRMQAESRQPSRLLTPVARLLMRIYWLSTSVVAFLVVVHASSTPHGLPGALVCFGALAIASSPALLLLRQRYRWDLIDLLAWTTR